MTEKLGSARCIRSALGFVVSVLFLCGWILLGIGVWLVVDPVYYEPAEMLELDNFNNVAYLILATASFLIILTILIGTILRNENEKLLPVFVVGMIILLLLSIAAIVLVVSYGFSDKLEEFLVRQILLNIQRFYDSEHSITIINFIQIKFKCCGATYVTDYERFRMHYPISCANDAYGNFLYFEGCAYKMSRFYETRAAIILGMFSFIILFILLAIALSTLFYCSLAGRSSSTDDD